MPHELVSSKSVYEGRFVNVRIDKVAVPGGHVEREVVEESSDGVLVVPVTDDGRIVLVEQSRHLFGATYEVPSGAINPGETPMEAAARELLEEACLTATSFELMSSHVNSVHMTGRNYYFLATGLAPGGGAVCDTDEEFIGRAELSFDEIERLIEEDRIPDLRNRGCLWLAQLRVLQKSAPDLLVPVG
jgi:ADP-ribose pyrophosphatase